RSPILLAAVGAVLVAGGLIGLSFLTHREIGWVIVMLALVGTGLGLGFPGLTTAALRTHGPTAARAAKTVAARDGGIILGLVLLTRVSVNQLNKPQNKAVPAATKAVLTAPMPAPLKFSLAPGLVTSYKHAAQSEIPNFDPTFARAAAHATPSERVALSALH